MLGRFLKTKKSKKAQQQELSKDSSEAIVDPVQLRMMKKFDESLELLKISKPFAKSTYQTDVFQLAETLMATPEGMHAVYERAHLFDQVGVFDGGPWANWRKLQAPLVSGSLKVGGVYPVVETLSELRLLAMATGRTENNDEQAAAQKFLSEVMALNLEYIFPGHTEEERIGAGPHHDMSLRLFSLLTQKLGLSSLCDEVVSEIEMICAQRPILSDRLLKMIELASRIPADQQSPKTQERLKKYTSAIHGASPWAQEYPDISDYRGRIKKAGVEDIETEAIAFAERMHETGLTSTHHAVLIRHLRGKHPELIAKALGLNEVGAAEFNQNQEFALQLIRFCIFPSTAQSIYGWSKFLEGGLLSRSEVTAGLTKLVDLDLRADVRENLLTKQSASDGVTANAVLVAGAISVFGQPLGVGQGHNPTCQAARAISLWAQHAHGYLLELLISAARDGFIEVRFEAEMLRTDQLVGGMASSIDFALDPVSIVLVRHLDLIYDAMMKRIVFREEDGHKWVNPSLYGRRVPNGFASVFFDVHQTTVAKYDDFVRRFFATHHPHYNDGHILMYPNPVGVLVTNTHGDYLGPHAITLQRIDEDPEGKLRVYFFNPNNEGRQDWGQEVRPSVSGHGELEGESSLPFHQFVSRLYAFHYNPYEEGDAFAVPIQEIEQIKKAAQTTWGRSFTWL